MLSLLLSVTVLWATSASGNTGSPSKDAKTDQSYTLAYQKSVAEDKPLMVVVGAQWCPACETLKNTTIASMEQNGELEQVSVAVVDRDAEPELAKALMADVKMIPQIILYTKTDDGRWNRRRLTGYQPTAPVRSLIRRISAPFSS